jgi:hypothetical protein
MHQAVMVLSFIHGNTFLVQLPYLRMEIHDAQNYLRIYIFKKEFFISIFVDCREQRKQCRGTWCR